MLDFCPLPVRHHLAAGAADFRRRGVGRGGARGGGGGCRFSFGAKRLAHDDASKNAPVVLSCADLQFSRSKNAGTRTTSEEPATAVIRGFLEEGVGPANGVLANHSGPADGGVADCPVGGGSWAGSVQYRALRAEGSGRDVAVAQRAAAGAGAASRAAAGRPPAVASRTDRAGVAEQSAHAAGVVRGARRGGWDRHREV